MGNTHRTFWFHSDPGSIRERRLAHIFNGIANAFNNPEFQKKQKEGAEGGDKAKEKKDKAEKGAEEPGKKAEEQLKGIQQIVEKLTKQYGVTQEQLLKMLPALSLMGLPGLPGLGAAGIAGIQEYLKKQTEAAPEAEKKNVQAFWEAMDQSGIYPLIWEDAPNFKAINGAMEGVNKAFASLGPSARKQMVEALNKSEYPRCRFEIDGNRIVVRERTAGPPEISDILRKRLVDAANDLGRLEVRLRITDTPENQKLVKDARVALEKIVGEALMGAGHSREQVSAVIRPSGYEINAEGRIVAVGSVEAVTESLQQTIDKILKEAERLSPFGLLGKERRENERIVGRINGALGGIRKQLRELQTSDPDRFTKIMDQLNDKLDSTFLPAYRLDERSLEVKQERLSPWMILLALLMFLIGGEMARMRGENVKLQAQVAKEQARAKAAEKTASDAQEQVKKLQGDLDIARKERDDAQKRADAAEKSRDQAQQQVKQTNSQIGVINIQINNLSKQLKEAQAKGAVVSGLQENIKKLEGDRTKLQGQLKEQEAAATKAAKNAADAEKARNDAAGRVTKLETDLDGARKAATKAEQERDKAQENAKKFEQQLKDAERKAAGRIKDLEGRLKKAETERDSAVKRAESAENQAKTLDQELGKIRKSLEGVNAQLKTLSDQITKSTDVAARQKLEKERASLEKERNDLSGQLSNTQGELTKAQKGAVEARAEAKKAEQDAENARKETEKAKKYAETLKTQVATLNKSIEELNKELGGRFQIELLDPSRGIGGGLIIRGEPGILGQITKGASAKGSPVEVRLRPDGAIELTFRTSDPSVQHQELLQYLQKLRKEVVAQGELTREQIAKMQTNLKTRIDALGKEIKAAQQAGNKDLVDRLTKIQTELQRQDPSVLRKAVAENAVYYEMRNFSFNRHRGQHPIGARTIDGINYHNQYELRVPRGTSVSIIIAGGVMGEITGNDPARGPQHNFPDGTRGHRFVMTRETSGGADLIRIYSPDGHNPSEILVGRDHIVYEGAVVNT